jgi:hypothetical protein
MPAPGKYQENGLVRYSLALEYIGIDRLCQRRFLGSYYFNRRFSGQKGAHEEVCRQYGDSQTMILTLLPIGMGEIEASG